MMWDLLTESGAINPRFSFGGCGSSQLFLTRVPKPLFELLCVCALALNSLPSLKSDVDGGPQKEEKQISYFH